MTTTIDRSTVSIAPTQLSPKELVELPSSVPPRLLSIVANYLVPGERRCCLFLWRLNGVEDSLSDDELLQLPSKILPELLPIVVSYLHPIYQPSLRAFWQLDLNSVRKAALFKSEVVSSLSGLLSYGSNFAYSEPLSLRISEPFFLSSIKPRFPRIQRIEYLGESVTDAVLQDLSHIETLRSLKFADGASFPPDVISSLSHCKTLTTLTLSSCPREMVQRLAPLGTLSELANLAINLPYSRGEVPCSDPGLRAISKISRLRSLKLTYWTGITPVGLRSLAALPQLTQLELSSCGNLTEEAVAAIGDCLALEDLSLWELDGITENGLLPLGQLRHLQRLFLSFLSEVTKNVYACLSHLPILHELSIWEHNLRIDSLGFVPFVQIKTLHTLRFHDKNSSLIGQGISDLPSLSLLEFLDIQNCFEMTDEWMEAIGQLLRLKMLWLYGGIRVTDRGISHLSRLSCLEDLALSNFTQITDQGLSSLQNCSLLRCLSIESCAKISPVGLQKLFFLVALTLRHCRLGGNGHIFADYLNVRCLSFDECSMTDQDLLHLVGLEELQLLSLSHNYLITESGVRAFLEKHLTVRYFFLSLSKKITKKFLDEFVEPLLEQRK